jgi:hypothetical protein
VLGIGLRVMFDAVRRKSHGRRLFVMANMIEIFCAPCLPLIMLWSLDLLASLLTNGPYFMSKNLFSGRLLLKKIL